MLKWCCHMVFELICYRSFPAIVVWRFANGSYFEKQKCRRNLHLSKITKVYTISKKKEECLISSVINPSYNSMNKALDI